MDDCTLQQDHELENKKIKKDKMNLNLLAPRLEAAINLALSPLF